MNYLIGVDIGTTSVKCIAVSMEGIVLADSTRHYPLDHPRSGYYEQRPEDIFQQTLDAISEVNSQCVKDQLTGISFSAAMHTLVAVDYQGNPLTPLITWADTRSQKYADKLLIMDLGMKVYKRTGTPIHPMSPLCKIAWIRDNLSEIYDQSYKFISIKEFIWYRLTSKYEVDYSIASATGLMDIHLFKWCDLALDYLSILPDRLADLVPITHIHQGIANNYAEKMGVSPDTPLVIGASDGCLANLGTGSIQRDEATVTIGTSGAIRMFADKPITDDQMRLFCYILDQENYLIGGAINNGGKALEWFMKNFAPEVNDWNDYIATVVETIPPGSEGLICMPYLMGERSPHWDSITRGIFFGLRSVHTVQHFARSVMEGIVFNLYWVGLALEEVHCPYHKVYVSGGFAKSQQWVRMMTDIFEKEICIPDSVQSSALGAVFVAMKAFGQVSSFQDLPFNFNLTHKFHPDPEKQSIYRSYFEIFQNLYPILKQEFARLNHLIS